MSESASAAQRTSHGHEGSQAAWLDLHFEANRVEYERALRMVGIQPGWHVLDAGTGAGNYLPWLADLVGEEGRITALDLEAENVATVRQRLVGWALPCEIEVVEGSILGLPLEAGAVDAVWCANVIEYLPDDDALAAVAEFRRVVRPGGLVALKDPDLRMVTMMPGHPAVFWRLFEDWLNRPEWSSGRGMLQSAGRLRHLLERGGLDQVWQSAIPIERWAPLSEVQQSFLKESLGFWATFSGQADLPDEDRAFWAQWLDPDAAEQALNQPDLYWREGQTVAVGRAPEG